MKGERQIIERLNKALLNELTAINQYFLHARMLKNWGFERLGKKEYEESIDEMKHADMLIERILFLEGLPNLQALGKLYIGESPAEIFQCDLRAEREALPVLTEGIQLCEKAGDFVSRELLEHILTSEEEHIDWLETQLSLIERLGEPAYLQASLAE